MKKTIRGNAVTIDVFFKSFDGGRDGKAEDYRVERIPVRHALVQDTPYNRFQVGRLRSQQSNHFILTHPVLLERTIPPVPGDEANQSFEHVEEPPVTSPVLVPLSMVVHLKSVRRMFTKECIEDLEPFAHGLPEFVRFEVPKEYFPTKIEGIAGNKVVGP